MKIILLIMLSLNILNANFTRSATGVVTDSITGLQWQDDITSPSLSWQGAIDYCEGLILDSKSDWRLPNKNELLSIVDYSVFAPSISSVFQNVVSNTYLSSTTHVGSTSYIWAVSFYTGWQSDAYKPNSDLVRCVRGQ
ncbi:MAG: DUF1566 domain-containing protein [Sulfurimonas sp.]|nr:DUF1566 domain-containing protein [Sulfurimonas sp.]